MFSWVCTTGLRTAHATREPFLDLDAWHTRLSADSAALAAQAWHGLRAGYVRDERLAGAASKKQAPRRVGIVPCPSVTHHRHNHHAHAGHSRHQRPACQPIALAPTTPTMSASSWWRWTAGNEHGIAHFPRAEKSWPCCAHSAGVKSRPLAHFQVTNHQRRCRLALSRAATAA